MRTISNGDDIIDSRDVIARIEELASEHEALTEAVTEAQDALDAYNAGSGGERHDTDSENLRAALDAANLALDEWTSGDDQEELSALRALEDDASGYSDDWRHGATLIRDSYFEDYARETAEDMHGSEMRAASWPFDCIDWEQAAGELQQDYTSVEYGDETYWVR
jgi:hypothetical protein